MAKTVRNFPPLDHFHRSQIGRAQRFIRTNFAEPLSLARIAREAGSSSFHFGRLFSAYTGETTFDFLRRIRLTLALKMLHEDAETPVTEIALAVGYETPSAFNKAFKRELDLSPTDFRQLGKAERLEKIHALGRTLKPEEIMNLKLTTQPEIITRPETHFVFVRKHGPFAEVAIPAWVELFPLLGINADQPVIAQGVQRQIREFLGTSTQELEAYDESSMVYEAGVGVAVKPEKVPAGLQYRKLPAGKYARFILTGPYAEVWPAFEKIFRILSESELKLRPGECIENYLNDPNVTPEDELLTELLVPVE